MKKVVRVVLAYVMCMGVVMLMFLPVHAQEASKPVICNHDYSWYMEEIYVGYKWDGNQHWEENNRVGRCGNCHVIMETLGVTIIRKESHNWDAAGKKCIICGYWR